MNIILIGIGICILLFASIRLYVYTFQKQNGHDTFYVFTKNGEQFSSCPNLEMFGFKFSVILLFCSLNLLLILGLYTKTKN